MKSKMPAHLREEIQLFIKFANEKVITHQVIAGRVMVRVI